MYLSPDDAKSDVILVFAVLLFGGLARTIVAQLPLYPRQGVLALVFELAWIVALTAAMPWWLSRYRGDGLRAFGLEGDRNAMASGIVLAAPIVVVSVITMMINGRSFTSALLGGVGSILNASGPDTGLLVAVQIIYVALTTLGATLVVSFLAIRSRDAFPRSPDTSLTELLRTYGLGAAAVALVIGALRSLGPLVSIVAVLLHVAAVAATVLIADRKLPARAAVSRAAVVGPAIMVLVIHIFAFGGLFRGDLPGGLYAGSLAASIAIVISVLVQLKGVAWAIVPMLVAAHWWNGPFSPLVF